MLLQHFIECWDRESSQRVFMCPMQVEQLLGTKVIKHILSIYRTCGQSVEIMQYQQETSLSFDGVHEIWRGFVILLQVTQIVFLVCQETDACMLCGMKDEINSDLSTKFACIAQKGNKSFEIHPLLSALQNV